MNIYYKKKLGQIFNRWKNTQAQARIYGVQTEQAKTAMLELFNSINEMLVKVKEISMVKKEETLELIAKIDIEEDSKKGQKETINLPIDSRITLKDFNRLKINSISFYDGIKNEELEKLFIALGKSEEFLQEYKGLRGFLENQEVVAIKIDQIEYRLLREEEHVTTGKIDVEKSKKMLNSAWKSYLGDKIKKEEFRSRFEEFIKSAKKDPKSLIKNIKQMAKRQKHVESFLANIEQKLFDLGFSKEVIDDIKKKLTKPKKVSILEDELARLKKIERDFQKTLEERIEDSVKSITELKDKLADEKARTESILRQTSQGVMVLDKSGKILATNPIAQKTLGLSTKDAQGKQLKDIIKDHHVLSIVSNWQNFDSNNIVKDVKTQSLKNGTVDTIRESAVVIEDQNANPIGVISTLQNVMEHEQLEKRKNDILDVLGHDLKVPIYAAKYNFSMLQDSIDASNEPDDKKKKMIDLCKSNIERMEKLVNKILDARRLETGKVILKKEEVDINKLIEESMNSLKTWSKDKDINLEVDIQDLPHTSADPERLYQVIINLVSNALKFTPQKGRIEVKAINVEDKTGKFIRISVKDSGVGIEKEDLKRVFEKYEQVRFKTTEGVSTSGLGLGLSICKSIIELHDGKIWVESKLNEGSNFIFQIPVLKEDKMKDA